MSVALRGNLQDFGIAEVFQLIGQQRKTGVLDVSHGGQTLRLAFDAGRVVWGRPVRGKEDGELGERFVRCGLITETRLRALRGEAGRSARSVAALAVDAGDVRAQDAAQIEQLVTNETIFVVLRWSEGSSDFSAQAVRHDRSQDSLLAAEEILMDGLRMADEWQTFASHVPSGETVFERNGPLTMYKRSLGEDARSRLAALEKVYSLVDGRLTAQRIIDLSRLGLFEGTRILAELSQNNVILALSKRQARARQRSAEGGMLKPLLDRAVWCLAAVVPMALLCGVVWTILEQRPAVPEVPAFPIVRAPLADAEEAFQKRRVRHALEARYLLSGTWPDDLTGGDETGLLDGRALTGAHGDAYYYARRGNGIVLLAPER